ncbi:hypothetical protein [Bacillus seohaeanensis]|uniref:Uncharacterized protein n=1 Tax=Bacillus seohaeanensis TaxID=284580 RepID=A0ABW5RXL7_9BACI
MYLIHTKRKFLIVLCISIFLTGCINKGETKKQPSSIDVALNERLELKLTTLDGEIELVDEQKSSSLNLYEDASSFFTVTKNSNTLLDGSVTVRKLNNKDLLIFTSIENKSDQPKSIDFSLTLPQTNRYSLTDWDQRKVNHPHDGNTGIDKTTQPIGLFSFRHYDNLRYEVVLGKQYTSLPVTKDYSNGLHSHLREIVSEKKKYQIAQQTSSATLDFTLKANKGETSEQWLMLSKEKFFSTNDELQSWIDYHLDSYKEANTWLTPSGPMKKLPWSIEPYTKKGYGRNLGVMVDREAIDRYLETHERYYHNLTINSVASLMEYRKQKDTTIWETEYTSTWLKKAYGLTAPYIDTRHNEFIALYLKKIGDELNIPQLQKAPLTYGDYLLEQINIGNVIKTENGVLISDYFSPYDVGQKTHASLNHILGGANLLLDCYIQSGEEKYLHAAVQIETGLEDLDQKWIRDNGDLWYQVNPDLTFAGNDYEQLTLLDLLKHQEKLEKAGLKRSAFIDNLLSSKLKYLQSKKIELIPDVQQELKSQGFH